MKFRPLLPSIALMLTATPAFAQSSVSDVIGGIVYDITPGSDNYFGVPFRQSAEFQGAIATISDVSGNKQIDFSGNYTFTADEFNTYYYVRIIDGDHAGEYYTIVDNDASSVTIDPLGDPLGDLAADDHIRIVKHWTLAEIFPPEEQTALVESPSALGFQREAELLFPDMTGTGTNRSASRIFFINQSTTPDQWQESGSTADAGDTIILPDMYFIIRQPTGASAASFTIAGTVESGPVASFIHSDTEAKHDNLLTLRRPIPVRLDELNLGDAFQGSPNTLGFAREDELLVWSNSDQAINKSVARIFFYNEADGTWRDSNDLSVADAYELTPGTAFSIRKSATDDGGTSVWVNQPTF